MRRSFTLSLLFALAACGGDAGGTSDVPGVDGATADAAYADAATDLAQDAPPADSAADATPTFHAIAGAPAEGTYRLATDDVELSVRVTDGRLFVVRAKLRCQGPAEAPCVAEQALPEINSEAPSP